MKKLIFYAIVLIWLSACTEVVYKNPQPLNTGSLKTFPEELRGAYESVNDDEKITITLGERYYSLREDDDEQIDGNISSDSASLKYYKGYYFLSHKMDELPYWILRVAKVQPDGTLSVLAIDADNHSIMDELRNSLEVKRVEHDDEYDKFFLIEPTRKELIKLIEKKVFQEVYTFKKIN
ncbi:hypothetical protein QQ008_06305 [Fulvivirgaceae bacterium BMA10]|uniref:Lipoprotein n=1 Tax=Splendidivirga corallicola TaxID=3051826 RepID=A0ABT8KJT1_9BACT|nr:hypothetical protein [Fulvivirgaceae bacterium BMA10]